jgi:apolipoprotein D and lipocalin family protein
MVARMPPITQENTMSPAPVSTALSKLLVLLGAAAAVALGVATAAPPVRTVEQFDAQRYAGMWYELARLPNRLQKRCVADATATYQAMADGTMSVVRRCREANQRFSVAVARAAPVAGDPARLRLSYLPQWLAWWPSAHDDHWVVLLDPDYRYAVVSDPSRQSLWILSRAPTIDVDTYDAIVERLRAQRYPVDNLVLTPQHLQRGPEAFAAKARLLV